MSKSAWRRVVLSDPDYEHLIAEIYRDDQLVFLLSREKGRDNVEVQVSRLSAPVLIDELIEQLRLAKADLIK